MKRALAAVFLSALLISVLAGTLLVNPAAANPSLLRYLLVRKIELGEQPLKGSTIPPSISFVSPENGTVFSDDSVVFAFNVTPPKDGTISELSGWVYYVTGWAGQRVLVSSSASPFSASFTLTGIRDGPHSVTVTAVYRGRYQYLYDWNSMTATRSSFEISKSSTVRFTVDTTLPRVSVLSPQNKTYSVTDVSLDFKVNEPTSRLTYSLDGEGNVTISGNMTLSGLSSGAHNVTVYAWDEAGNVGASETVSFTVDVREPLSTGELVAASTVLSIAVVSFGLLGYFVKSKRKKGEL